MDTNRHTALPRRTLIFDLDGTLVDSLEDLGEAVNVMLAACGRPSRSLAEIRGMIGQGARNLVERALGTAQPAEVEQALPIFLDYNLRHIADRTHAYPGVAETLTALAARGFTMAVLSNKDTGHCRQLLERLGLAHHFAAIWGADAWPERKPSPAPVLALLAALGATPAEAVLVGDSVNDVRAGIDASLPVIGCRYGYGGDAELAGATWCIDRVPALLELDLLRNDGLS